ncbi:hypothetical protein [Horticoccus sp. 23ND18S-11]|uniref:hypothetical protein n=1 Tax=Horticoccus sp. 23ND18S-11 TaxID=3391832 RepID=UPI0039C92024
MITPSAARRAFAWGKVSVLGGLACLACVTPRLAGGAEPKRAKEFNEAIAAKFAGVEEWRGMGEMSEISRATWSTNLEFYDRQAELSTRSTFVLRRAGGLAWDPANGVMRWQGSGEVTGSQVKDFDNRTLGGAYAGEYERWQEVMAGTMRWDRWQLSIAMAERYPSLDPGVPADLEVRRLGEIARRPSSSLPPVARVINETGRNFLRVFRFQETPEDRSRFWAQLAGGPGIVTLTTRFVVPDKGRPQQHGDLTVRSRVVMYPVYDDVEVEVTIPGYAEWRPKGNIAQPKLAGSALAARAVLKSKAGKTKSLPEVEFFRFELLDTSREPGVCLNWPLGAKDDDYDLRLANFGTMISGSQMAAAKAFFTTWGLQSAGDYDLASLPSGELPRMSFGEVTLDGQKAELRAPPKDQAGQPYAEAAIECFDFGAKAELRVTCVLKDGRQIIGLMKGAGGEQDLVRLPKRAGPDWIAEQWRKENEATSLSASDDNEKIEGQRFNGDGFTLYEEYRGWVVGGKHVTGDPKRKDFFVLNLIGADAATGIGMFEAVAKLRVHRLRAGEMSEQARLLNGNHRDAPHRVAQHGVWVKHFSRSGLGDTGAATVMEKKGVAGRPGLVKGIGLLARNNPESAFNQPFNVAARDLPLAYDRAVAHELLHSVGVEEHGPDETQRHWLSLVPPGAAGNQTGRPRYQTAGGEMFTVLTETGENLADKNYQQYLATKAMLEQIGTREIWKKVWASTYANLPPGSTTLDQRAEEYVEQLARAPFELNGIVGQEGRQHSGAEDCVMRYYFARFYEAKGRPNTLYLVTPGTERISYQICHSPTGTGANAAGRSPQSRYGNATLGNCFAQICPNDAVPPAGEK